MTYRYRSRRSSRRMARKSRRNFIITLILIGILVYATLNWILPYFIGSIGALKNVVQPPQQFTKTENLLLAPPVLNIPYEATNSAQIDIKGFSTPNSKVKIFVDDELKTTVDVSSDGSFIAEMISLNLGLNNINGKTIDETSRESLPSKTIVLAYSTDKPNLVVNQPEEGKKIEGGEKKVTVSGKTDPGVKIFINESQIIVDKDGNFTSDLPINEGNNSINIKALNIFSNITEKERQVIYTPTQ